MTEQALQARRAYRRAYSKKWRAENKDKIKEYHERYWEKKGREALEKDNHA